MDPLFDGFAAYEVAYGFRDVGAECDFLLSLGVRRNGRPARSAVELGCGPGTHIRELSERGLKCYAVDHNPAALEHLAATAPKVVPILGDLRGFRLPEPVELAFSPLGTFAYLLTEADWQQALAAAAEALRPGGTLVLELAPGDAERRDTMRWTAYRDGWTVTASAGPSRPAADGTFFWALSLVAEGPDGRREWSIDEHQVAVSAARVEDLLADAHFVEVELFADWDCRRRWQREETVIAVARRRPA